jgi:DNA polymerase III alpha subunit
VACPESRRAARRGGIRPGLEFVKSLAAATIKQILQQRTVRPFESLEDFCDRVRLTREEMENLILCGAFDSFGLTRPTLMMKMDRILGRPHHPRRDAGATLLTGSGGVSPPAPVPVPDQPPFPLRERVLMELRILGFSHSGHPLDAWDGEPGRMRSTPSFQMKKRAGQRVAFAGWLVTMRRAVTKKHQYMEFLTLEDRHGVIEAILFPDVYRRYGRLISGAGCYRLTGTVKAQFGSVSLVADSLHPLELQQSAPASGASLATRRL